MGSEEGAKERKRRKKREGKRKKKRSSVPNVDDSQNSTLGQDNAGIDYDESLTGSDQAKTVPQQGRTEQSVDSMSLESSKGEHQASTVELEASESGQVFHPHEETVSVKDEGTDLTTENTGVPTPGDHPVRSAESKQGLRRRATLTEMGKSFDEEEPGKEKQESNEVSLYVIHVISSYIQWVISLWHGRY